MGIQNWSKNVILVDLLGEPEMGEELASATEMFRNRADCDIVIDFSVVDIVTSSSLSKLLKLQKMVKDCDQHLVLCGVAPATWRIFEVTGLDEVFEFVDDKFMALSVGINPREVSLL